MQTVDESGATTPDSTATGTSTSGVRIPPSTMPSASRASCGVAPSVVSKRGALGGGVPVRTHSSSVCNAGLGDELHRAVVHRQPAVDRRRDAAEQARVGVRGAGHLPEAEMRVVGLARLQRLEQTGVALGLDVEDLGVLVGAEDRRCGAERPLEADGFARLGQRHACVAAAVHEVAVERVGEWRDAVDVRDERGGRLGFSRRRSNVAAACRRAARRPRGGHARPG